MTEFEKKQAREFLLRKQEEQNQRRRQAEMDKADEEVFALFRNRRKVEATDTTRSIIMIPTVEQAQDAEYEEVFEPYFTPVMHKDVNWQGLIVAAAYIGSMLLAVVMLMGWTL